VAREWDGPDGGVNTVCPLHGAAGGNPLSDQASAPDLVDWAGLPVHLDLVFSREQRDKVYVQHLMRKRGTEVWRLLHDDAHSCVCDTAADHRRRYPDAAESMSSR
jgi:hypothetical protein